MFLHKVALTASTLARILVGIGTFVILARVLGPKDFGLFGTTFAYGSVLALLTDFGLPQQALRDIGADRTRAGAIIVECLQAKIVASVLSIPVPIVVVLSLDLTADEQWSVLALIATTLVTSYADMAIVTLRGVNAFWLEARLVIANAILHGVLFGGAAVVGWGMLELAALFLASRAIYLVSALCVVWRVAPLTGMLSGSLRLAARKLKRVRGFALDSALTAISSQMDAILVPALLGLEASGLYQAGARITQGALTFTAVLGGVHTPELSRLAVKGGSTFKSASRRVFLDFILFGVLAGGAIALAGPYLVRYAFGSSYLELNRLWLGFAIFVAARYFAAGFGVQLVSIGAISSRVWGQLAAGLVFVAASMLLLPQFGVAAAPWAMLLSTCALAALYGFRVLRPRLPGAGQDPSRLR